MKASEATALTLTARTPNTSTVQAVLSCWYAAIVTAGKAGRNSVRESETDRLRCPVTVTERLAALRRLEVDGFTVRTVTTGPNESEVEVVWPAPSDEPQGLRKIVPPRGGSGTASLRPRDDHGPNTATANH